MGPFPIEAILAKWDESKRFAQNTTIKQVVPAQPGTLCPLPEDLSPRIREWLSNKGIGHLYSHQAESWKAFRDEENICLSTPTASGKSLCYHLPVLQRILEKPESRALYIFPTKALAQDQYKSVHGMISEMDLGVKTYTYDGDTPQAARQAIRSNGHIVISNPDMIHTGVLPHHTKWLKLFENLDTVVIDEIHAYRGVFGSHLCNILRRLKRIAAFHGSSPRFITCSATIANPKEYAELLVEQPVKLIDKSGAPTGKKTLYFFNPPVLNKELGIRASYIKTAKRIAFDLFQHRISNITFALSRLNVEILVKYLREDAKRSSQEPEEIQGYRGGYLPLHRRHIEAGLRNGKIRSVVATNALELGIDIGQLSACVIAGYPGTIASLWQQSGRAGRRTEDAVTVFVARSNPLDQFIVQNPEYFFGASPEHARINGDNLYILAEHVKCAAFELPFRTGDRFGELTADDTDAILEHLTSHNVLHRTDSAYHWMNRAFPANDVNIRNIPGENFVVIEIESGAILAEVDYRSTQTTLHENAIYNLDGLQYQVETLDWENHKAYVKRVQADFFTDAMTYNRVQVLSVAGSCLDEPSSVRAEYGEVSVTEKVVGFKKVRFYTSENVGFGDVTLPEQTMHTTAYWFTIPKSLLRTLEMDQAQIIDGLLGISHALYYVSVMALMCDAQDLGRCVGDKSAEWFAPLQNGTGANYSHSMPPGSHGLHEQEIFDPTLFIYDAFPGGVGFAEKLFHEHDRLLRATSRMIESCPCENGCPSCVGALITMNDRTKIVPLRILGLLLEPSLPRTDATPVGRIENPPILIALHNDHSRILDAPTHESR